MFGVIAVAIKVRTQLTQPTDLEHYQVKYGKDSNCYWSLSWNWTRDCKVTRSRWIRNVTVNAVAPGPVATELFLEGKTQEQIMQLSRLTPMERLREPLDTARVVSFLAGPDRAGSMLKFFALTAVTLNSNSAYFII